MCCPAICFAINEALAKNDGYRIESVVHGHDIYKTVWTPRLGEELETQREPDNQHDQLVSLLSRRTDCGACAYERFRDTFLSVGLATSAVKSPIKENFEKKPRSTMYMYLLVYPESCRMFIN